MNAVLALVFSAATAIGLDEHVGARAPTQLAFTDTHGEHVTLGKYFDGHRPVVLVMAYARCTMLCSVVLRGLADAVRATHGDYLPIVVSLDPHETWNEAASRQDRLLVEAGRPRDRDAWPYLVGDAESVAMLADTLGFRYAWDPETKQYAHPAVAFVLTPDARVAEYLRGITFDGLGAAIARAARGELTPSIARDLLSCFHFDPALRRYESRIAAFYKLGAALVFLVLVAMISGFSRLEHRAKRLP